MSFEFVSSSGIIFKALLTESGVFALLGFFRAGPGDSFISDEEHLFLFEFQRTGVLFSTEAKGVVIGMLLVRSEHIRCLRSEGVLRFAEQSDIETIGEHNGLNRAIVYAPDSSEAVDSELTFNALRTAGLSLFNNVSVIDVE